MYNIQYHEQYEKELDNILIDIIINYHSSYADKIVGMIDDTVKILKVYPRAFAVYQDNPYYHKFVIDSKYTVFYIIDDNKQSVILMHIIPSIRDIINLLD